MSRANSPQQTYRKSTSYGAEVKFAAGYTRFTAEPQAWAICGKGRVDGKKRNGAIEHRRRPQSIAFSHQLLAKRYFFVFCDFAAGARRMRPGARLGRTP